MIKLLLKRIFPSEEYTIGKLYINGQYFCDTLEDKVRNLPPICPNTKLGNNCKCPQKVFSETAIPPGTYKITIDRSPRFGRDLPRLHDVPHFLGILIHRGNTAKDSAGCILVGENKIPGKVINSTGYEQRLVELLRKENNITIEIV